MFRPKNTSLIPLLFFFMKVSVPSQESEWTCICAFAFVSTKFLLNVGTLLAMWNILHFIFSRTTKFGHTLNYYVTNINYV